MSARAAADSLELVLTPLQKSVLMDLVRWGYKGYATGLTNAVKKLSHAETTTDTTALADDIVVDFRRAALALVWFHTRRLNSLLHPDATRQALVSQCLAAQLLRQNWNAQAPAQLALPSYNKYFDRDLKRLSRSVEDELADASSVPALEKSVLAGAASLRDTLLDSRRYLREQTISSLASLTRLPGPPPLLSSLPSLDTSIQLTGHKVYQERFVTKKVIKENAPDWGYKILQVVRAETPGPDGKPIQRSALNSYGLAGPTALLGQAVSKRQKERLSDARRRAERWWKRACADAAEQGKPELRRLGKELPTAAARIGERLMSHEYVRAQAEIEFIDGIRAASGSHVEYMRHSAASQLHLARARHGELARDDESAVTEPG